MSLLGSIRMEGQLTALNRLIAILGSLDSGSLGHLTRTFRCQVSCVHDRLLNVHEHDGKIPILSIEVILKLGWDRITYAAVSEYILLDGNTTTGGGCILVWYKPPALSSGLSRLCPFLGYIIAVTILTLR